MPTSTPPAPPRASTRLRVLLIAALAIAAQTTFASPTAPVDSPEEHFTRRLFLAGGALPVCSSMGRRACTSGFELRTSDRSATRHRLSEESIREAVSPELWPEADHPLRDHLEASLAYLKARLGSSAIDTSTLEDALFATCTSGTSGHARRCRRSQIPTWSMLTDGERNAVLSALQVAQLDKDGNRLRERVDVAATAEPDGLDVLRAFVEAAGRGGAQRPRIAVVTASALDPFDAVDFYLGTFEALGAEAQWWPLDAALSRALEEGRDCSELDALRHSELKLAGRERVYPDLAEQQRSACADPKALARLPDAVDGVFFAGGDQWRLRRAFFDRSEQPLPWLHSLRAAHARGELVVGGTSAGAAVQSGAAMLSNGSPASALQQPGLAMAPPEPGCGRAQRCGEGIDEDRLSFWPAGGLGLARDAVVDTHFSERAREPRLLRMLAQTDAAIGYGADEASALEVVERGESREVRARGRSGGWVFLPAANTAADRLSAHVFYLAAGTQLTLAETEPARLQAPDAHACPEPEPLATPHSADASTTQTAADQDALQPGALRAAARKLAECMPSAVTLNAGAGAGRIHLERLSETRSARGHAGAAIGPLRMTFEPE